MEPSDRKTWKHSVRTSFLWRFIQIVRQHRRTSTSYQPSPMCLEMVGMFSVSAAMHRPPPTVRDMHIRLTGFSELSVGVKYGCLSLCVGPWNKLMGVRQLEKTPMWGNLAKENTFLLVYGTFKAKPTAVMSCIYLWHFQREILEGLFFACVL